VNIRIRIRQSIYKILHLHRISLDSGCDAASPSSMENLANISGPQVPPNEQRDQ